ncbi:MAG: prefoldin subunit beta [Thermoprotei archaeon]|nr:MAG: prefoldin subunit beta [Thermoprotei archaeon]RLF03289.1 MAG: prefoldin subunit beta [Thermoprotei archaeon]
MAEALPERLRTRVAKFQQLQNELQLVILRRQQVELQLKDVEAALNEISKALEKGEGLKLYKLVGPILVSAEVEELKKELEEKKEIMEVRLKTLQKHENLLRKQVEDLRKELEKELRQPSTETTEAG